MRLMCDMELSVPDVESRFGIDFNEYFKDSLKELEEFIEGGFIIAERGKYKVVENGRLIIRNIAMCFDAYLDKMKTGKPIFSRTV
jgi:oxygen-independent coproporphyrinogen-3 oxidase